MLSAYEPDDVILSALAVSGSKISIHHQKESAVHHDTELLVLFSSLICNCVCGSVCGCLCLCAHFHFCNMCVFTFSFATD